ncbi:MtaA/CmuA family methyltransferase [Methermicoccus shengliensis]|uniref:MtaA/CmuA family methyltransferase n=1 Tax=Methermicoccus shengliensis TaxID=660064 RepID=UPI0005B28D99|nr:MtaA/CmuA family methyltransferase [Methermicoccus shengliensis]KUK04365.1 MAG: Methanol-specific methylcobalamin:CoM methyltransferase [Euryarchaeota archaeon 55_53]KUK30176.1 MAG: Methanol-specific methylcobalamin:CoM methyltransferase [Methanosarcinales archeaon 56_1174]MDI3488458.1 [methyl-Co(III) methanol/glycine betaine-specific corrinoid protein]:coenzyme methyltransferase [Methanosarcinales archaeon]MDN5295736.1 [methyl-Co(III) methanol/glycine betaine-specific corrinoid protein]:coe
MTEMTPKERVLAALQKKEVDRVPATSVTQTGTVEFMQKAGVFWPEAHKHVDQMVKLAKMPYQEVGLETARVPYCLTVEADALGVPINWGNEERQPSVKETPYEDVGDIPYEDFLEKGRVPVVLKAVEQLQAEVGDELPIMAGVTGPVTLAGHLMGVEKFIRQSMTEPDEADMFVELATEVLKMYAEALVDAGADVVVPLDPVASPDTIIPTSFETLALPHLKDLHRTIHSKGALAVLHICGNVKQILTLMAETGADGLSIEEKVSMAEAKKMVGDKVALVGNVSSIDPLLLGDPEKVQYAVMDALDGGTDLCAPGCGIAPKTPTANLAAFVEGVKEYFA